MSILCIGQSAYDIMIPLGEPIVENQKYRFHQVIEGGGGPAMTAACLLARWGAQVQLVSRIGEDEYGRKLRAILRQYGVGTDCLIPDQAANTPYSFIFINQNNGSRTIFNHPGHLAEVDYEPGNVSPEVILSDGHEEKISIRLIQRYPQAVSVLDGGTCRDSTLAVARYVDYLVCSKDFAQQYTGTEIHLENWARCQEIFAEVERINGKQAVITLGDRGLLYRESGQLRHLPAYRMKAVDTTGAGDIFHGAFAYGLYKKLPLLENLMQSSMAAAISVRTFGGQASIPRFDQVRRELESGGLGVGE